MLLFGITILAFIQTYSHLIVKLIIKIVSYVKDGPKTQFTASRDKISDMSAELSKISMTDEWAKYVKLQRKIIAEKNIFEKMVKEDMSSNIEIRGYTTFAVKAIIGFILFILTWWHRKEVVARIHPDMMYPISSYICWSSDIPGGITVPAWIILSFSGARAVSSFH